MFQYKRDDFNFKCVRTRSCTAKLLLYWCWCLIGLEYQILLLFFFHYWIDAHMHRLFDLCFIIVLNLCVHNWIELKWIMRHELNHTLKTHFKFIMINEIASIKKKCNMHRTYIHKIVAWRIDFFSFSKKSCLFNFASETVHDDDGNKTAAAAVSMATMLHRKDLAVIVVFFFLLKKCHRHFKPFILNCTYIFTVSLPILYVYIHSRSYSDSYTHSD